jgi:hypothetical protein
VLCVLEAPEERKTMTEKIQTERSSAKIYQFPVKANVRDAGKHASGRNAVELLAPKVEFGSGWYHDDAIQDVGHPPHR